MSVSPRRRILGCIATPSVLTIVHCSLRQCSGWSERRQYGRGFGGSRLECGVVERETQYAKSSGVSIAYQVVGEGATDLILVPGFASHVEVAWEEPRLAHFLGRLASFSRLIVFDKRGTGMSDPVASPPSMDLRMDDIRAVMDAAGSRRAALFGISEGGTLSLLFARAHPERTQSIGPLRVVGPSPSRTRLPLRPVGGAARRHRSAGWTGRGRPVRGGTGAIRARPTIRGTAPGGPATCGWRRARRWRRTSSG